jgi:hypothetical protein
MLGRSASASIDATFFRLSALRCWVSAAESPSFWLATLKASSIRTELLISKLASTAWPDGTLTVVRWVSSPKYVTTTSWLPAGMPLRMKRPVSSTRAFRLSVGISTRAPIRPLPVVLFVTMPVTTPGAVADASAATRRGATAVVSAAETRTA